MSEPDANPSDDRLLALLRDRFGLPGFRGTQREVIDHLLAGGDAIVVWPTGSGKSLVYQLPALAQEKPVVVLSPLIALMQDQVAALRARGIEATFINSSLDRAQRDARAADFARGRYRLLYVTPERFRSEPFRRALAGVSVGLLAVDEAHCITSWGHDFRPEYGRVGRIRELLGNPPTVALTATATPDVIREIGEKLALAAPRIDHAGIARPNLFLAASIVHDEEEKWERLAARLDRLPGAGIVYGALIKDLHRLEDFLNGRGARAASAGNPGAIDERFLIYHGDLSREERRAMHERFHAGADRILATRAFGMGIDKADLRFILHAQVTGSVEELWQEIGRAGRDGQPAWCELLYCEQDLPIQLQFVRSANPDRALFRAVTRRLAEATARGELTELESLRRATVGRSGDGRVETVLGWLEALGVLEGDAQRGTLKLARPLEPGEEPEELGAEKETRDLQRLQKVVDYVRSERCRRRFLLDYFGLDSAGAPENCGACDVCVDREVWLRDHLPPRERPSIPVTAIASTPAPPTPARGDFVTVDGHRVGRVVRVDGEGRRARVHVELADSLDVRVFPVGRVSVVGAI